MPRPFSEGEKCPFTWDFKNSTVQDELESIISLFPEIRKKLKWADQYLRSQQA
jgi:hypothetical protein